MKNKVLSKSIGEKQMSAHSEKLSCFLIGEDHLIIECADVLINKQYSIVGMISSQDQTKDWAHRHSIPLFKSFEDAESILSKVNIDYLFSIVNSKIIPNMLLDRVRKLSINYHHSPLPQYAGVNAPSWAILNNEKKHGVTWHVMNDIIDSGDLLKQALFTIEDHETALSLNLKCYQNALALFENLASELPNNKPKRIPQELDKRSYYTLNHKPEGNGWIDWHSLGEKIERYFRAFYLGAHDNRLSLLKFNLHNDIFIINELKLSNDFSKNAPGTINEINPFYWKISTASKDVIITQVVTQDGKNCTLEELAKKYHINKATILQSPTIINIKLFESVSTSLFKYESYWIKKLANFKSAEIPFLSTTCTNTEEDKSFKSIQFIELTDILLSKIQKISNHQDMLPFFLTIWLIYLYRLGNNENLGIALSHPELYQHQEIRNFFATQVPFLIHFGDEMSFEEIFYLVIKKIQLVKDKKTYLKDVFFRYQSLANKTLFFPIAVMLEDSESLAMNKLDSTIVFKISMLHKRLEWFIENSVIEQSKNLQAFVNNSSNHFCTLMAAIISNPRIAIQDLPLLTSHEKQMQLVAWNNTRANYPREKNICFLLDEQVCRTPNTIALQFNNLSVSYYALKIHVDNLAHYFIKNLSIKPQQPVIIHMDRGFEWIISLLAILKIGAIYVPVVSNTPLQRFKLILKDSNALYILSSKEYLEKIEPNISKEIQCIDISILLRKSENRLYKKIVPNFSSNNTAYILYTSGTTGLPKGVLIRHYSLVNLVYEQIKSLGIDANSKVLQFASLGFDASIWEIFSTLTVGGTLCIPSEKQILVGEELTKVINTFKVTLVTLPPSILQTINPSDAKTLKTVITAGEPCSKELATHWVNNVCLINAYGPTETTVCATMSILSDKNDVTIGKPIANTQVYVLDKNHNLVPAGVIGELYVGGDCLAVGYLNKPELTNQYFIPNPFATNVENKIYKTRDLVRWLPDGNLEFIGRIDNQVKLRGLRIEIEAIETQILHNEKITQCAVALKHNEKLGKFLVAYLVLQENVDLNALREALRENLPYYMIPNFFVALDKLPLTENGKIDRKSLPEPELTTNFHEHPTTEIEKKLVQIWTQVLGIEKIGIYDDFFNLGGNSLLLSQLILALRDNLHFEIHFSVFLKSPTIASLAELVSKKFHNILDDNYNKRFLNDTHLAPEIIPVNNKVILKKPNSVLLTGATGFLGSHLLSRLSHDQSLKIYCLVRATSSSEGKKLIEEAMAHYNLNTPIDNRIIPIVGDLSAPCIGLDQEIYTALAKEIDEIYHNGAFVNHLYNYEMLRAPNVLGTIEILKFASLYKNKPLHYISTLSAMCHFVRKDGLVLEDFITHDSEAPPNDGYSQTKWVSEKLLAEASNRNFSINIYRPGWIFGNTVTGRFPATGNHLLLLIKGCIQMGFAPNWDVKLNILPVDFVSSLIIDIATSNVFDNKVFNFSNRNQIAWVDIIHCLNEYGYDVKLIPSHTWIDSLKEIEKNNALFNLLPLYLNSDHGWEKSLNKISLSHDANLQQAMDMFGMTYPSIDSALLFKCFSFLKN